MHKSQFAHESFDNCPVESSCLEPNITQHWSGAGCRMVRGSCDADSLEHEVMSTRLTVLTLLTNACRDLARSIRLYLSLALSRVHETTRSHGFPDDRTIML